VRAGAPVEQAIDAIAKGSQLRRGGGGGGGVGDGHERVRGGELLQVVLGAGAHGGLGSAAGEAAGREEQGGR
jgi:hypothetical protein